MDVVYFELNDWFSGRDYPETEPFNSWINQDFEKTLGNEEWVKNNKLCLVAYPLDMSYNCLISASKDWVLDNCPDLLSDKGYDYIVQVGSINGWEDKVEHRDYKNFLRFPDEDGNVYGRGNIKFADYKEENFGITYTTYCPPMDDDEDEDE